MDKVKNIYIFGTSNSIKYKGYFEKISKSSRFQVVGSSRMGDVPISYFLNEISKIESISKTCKIDAVVIDSCINDVLMMTEGVLTPGSFQYFSSLFANELSRILSCSTICFLNFMPEMVVKKEFCQQTLKTKQEVFSEAGFDTLSLNYSYEEDCSLYPPSDPLHMNVDLTERVESDLYNLLSGYAYESERKPMDKPCSVKVINFSDLDGGASITESDIYSTNLLQIPTINIEHEDYVSFDFTQNIGVLGISFVSTNSSNVYLRIDLDGSFYYVSTSSKYDKRLLRYLPFTEDMIQKNVRCLKLSLASHEEAINSNRLLYLSNQGQSSDVTEDISESLALGCFQVQFRETTENNIVNSAIVKRAKTFFTPLGDIENSSSVKVYFELFWKGFNPKNDPIFGKLFSESFDVEIVEEIAQADVVVVSCFSYEMPREKRYEQLRASFPGNIIYYTAEHDGWGINGIDQIDFKYFDYVISHYLVRDPRHIWMPLYVRQYGLNVFSSVNEAYLSNIGKVKNNNVQFCYGNDACSKRNQDFHKLDGLLGVDSGGPLYNNMGYCLPKAKNEYLKILSDYKFVFAYENSSYPGYNTEKLIHALMAGTVPFYWGDPLVTKIVNPNVFYNMNVIPSDGFFTELANDPDHFFSLIAAQRHLPFPNAERLSLDLYDYYQEKFKHALKKK